MGKKILLLVPLIIIIAAGAFFYMQLNPAQGPLAQLLVEQGIVEYSSGGDFLAASNGMELKENYIVRTGQGAKASIVLRESSVVRLDGNTEIAISEIAGGDDAKARIRQNNGRAWNQVLRMSGFDSYEVETPTTVATVRGTSFDCNLREGEVWFVDDGSIGVAGDGNYVVDEDTSLSVDENGVGTHGGFIEDEWISQNRAKDEAWLEQVKQRLRERYAFLIGTAKQQGTTDDQIEEWLDGYVRSTLSVQDAIDQGLIPGQFISMIPEELKRY